MGLLDGYDEFTIKFTPPDPVYKLRIEIHRSVEDPITLVVKFLKDHPHSGGWKLLDYGWSAAEPENRLWIYMPI